MTPDVNVVNAKPGAAAESASAADRERRAERLLRRSAVLTLVSLALMVWSVFVPRPVPVMVFMSLGQLLGTLAFALYLLVVLRDLLRWRRVPATSPQRLDVQAKVA